MIGILGKNLIRLSEKTYLLIFSIALSGLSAFLYLVVIPEGWIEYNLGTNLFASLVTTVITVVFLSVFLAVREEREWRTVKEYVISTIATELSALFGEILRLTESEIDESSFKLSLSITKEAKIRKEMIFSKLSELHKKKSLELTPSAISAFKSNKEMLVLFSNIKKNLADIQIRYGRHLNSKITEELIRLQDALELVKVSHKLDRQWNNFQQTMLPPLKAILNNIMQDQKISSIMPLEHTLPVAIRTLIHEIHELWKLEIQFDLA